MGLFSSLHTDWMSHSASSQVTTPSPHVPTWGSLPLEGLHSFKDYKDAIYYAQNTVFVPYDNPLKEHTPISFLYLLQESGSHNEQVAKPWTASFGTNQPSSEKFE